MEYIVRTPRGRWGLLSPAFPWHIKDGLKEYNSLLNYIYDDIVTNPIDLLCNNDYVSEERVINGLKLLILQNPSYKKYLLASPPIKYLNRYQTDLELIYTLQLKNAKDALHKYRVKGEEVLYKRDEFEMLGATINGDEAVFEYDAKTDVDKSIYGTEVDLSYICNFLETYIYINKKSPDFCKELDVVNPAVYYKYNKKYGERISKLLTKFDISKFRDFIDIDINSTISKCSEIFGTDLIYYIFPKSLHYSLNGDIMKIYKYHLKNSTIHLPEIQNRFRLLDYIQTPKNIEIIKQKIINEFTVPHHSKASELPIFEDSVIEEFVISEDQNSAITSESTVETPEKESEVVEKSVEPPIEKPVEPPIEKPIETPIANIKYEWLSQTYQIGKLVDPEELISPFNKKLISYNNYKFSGIIEAIYNHAYMELLQISKQVTQATAKKKLLQKFEEHELDKWWKERGIVHLKNITSGQYYTEKYYSYRFKESKPLVFIASKRVLLNPIFEQYIGIIRVGPSEERDNTFAIKGIRYKGYNILGQLL